MERCGREGEGERDPILDTKYQEDLSSKEIIEKQRPER